MVAQIPGQCNELSCKEHMITGDWNVLRWKPNKYSAFEQPNARGIPPANVSDRHLK